MTTPELILTVIFASIALFLAMRYVICWYLKINKRAELLEEILKQLTISNQRAIAGKKESHYD